MKKLLLILVSLMINNSSLAKVDTISLSLVKLEKMVEFKELERRSTISYMKVSLRMTFIMVMVGTSIPTVISILAIGSMGNAQDGVSSLTSLVKFMKACGRTVSSLETESPKLWIYQKLNCN